MSEPRIEDQPIEPDAGGAEAAPVARPVGRLAIWGVSAAVIGVFLAVDFITPDIPDDAPLWQAAFCGIGVGQVSLIATWAVLRRETSSCVSPGPSCWPPRCGTRWC